MAREHLDTLGLDREQVRRTLRFHEAYAATALRELESVGPVDENTAFTLRADAASALREAGQWALLLNPMAARRLLRRSGDLFLQLGQAFGMYLELVADRSRFDVEPAMVARALRDASGSREEPAPTADAPNPMPDIRLQQQQQAYLVLAASGIANSEGTVAPRLRPVAKSEDYRFDPLSSSLGEILESSPHRTGVLPVGSLGTPIHRFWAVAEHLFRRRSEDVRGIARHVVAMCRTYEETISLARTNTHLWRNGAAPVDIADLDIAGIATLTARSFGEGALLEALAEVPGGDLSPISRIPVELGTALATGPDDYSSGR
ncbi:hypothetical protein [Amycolatopsis vancoresmycina]|uniref:Uncharacterized protein n=1 Tax=Amycolatopsis vancoresmycina DSM 44592 TaxID=1292037 RepID=R1GD81_9PSEU|nr:hypothetical protein [Amycolatopsis vancoresmycina]EOD69297.1 hypothetical protein H480_06838 [Amycolatopsis vancoresmycina DSM 44592]